MGVPRDEAKEAKEKKPKRRRLREMPARVIARTPWLRRRYARRLLRSIRKSREKGRKLPENLVRIERQIRHLPPARQQQLLEQMMEYGTTDTSEMSREMRRAAERQERQRGSGKGVRPGVGPGQRRRG